MSASKISEKMQSLVNKTINACIVYGANAGRAAVLDSKDLKSVTEKQQESVKELTAAILALEIENRILLEKLAGSR